MNRRALIGGAAAIAIAVFGAAAYTVNRRDADAAKAEAEAQAKKATDDNMLVRPHSPVMGNPDAAVTVVEFFDPSCEACRAFHPYVKDLLREFDGKIRVVLRYAALHPGSDEAVRILETARLQGKFEPVLEALLENQPLWAMHDGPDLEKAWQFAGAAGLDVEKAKADKMQPGIVAVLNADAADVEKVGLQGTPTFIVNGKPLTNFSPDGLKALIQAEVHATGAS